MCVQDPLIMTIETNYQPADRSLTIAVNGRFDFSCHEAFRTAYADRSELCDRYVVDLEQTEYLDSSALGMLLLLRDYGGGDAAQIEIQGCNATVRKTFAISNFDQLFRIY